MQFSSAEKGFSLLELLLTMTVTVLLASGAATFLFSTMRMRTRENQRGDALKRTQTALDMMTRELANSGFGLNSNGLILTDCDSTKIHFRANLNNSNGVTTDAGEDVVFAYQSATNAIVRYDARDTPQTQTLASNITALNIAYTDYTVNNLTGAVTVTSNLDAASVNTGRLTVTVTVNLPATPQQPAATVALRSDVALRNSAYLLNGY